MTSHAAHKVVLHRLLLQLDGREDHPNDPPKTSASYLREFAMRAIHVPYDFPIDKLGRWTGFIQGVMAARGWISVDAERDRTRPIFMRASGQ